MEIHSNGVVIGLSQADATTLASELAATLKLAYGTRRARPPRFLEAFAGEISREASSATFRKDTQASTRRGTGEFRDGPAAPSSEQPVRLSVREAAHLANVSEGLMRRCCRRGDVQASQGHRRAWAVDIASLTAWMSQRRKEHESKAA